MIKHNALIDHTLFFINLFKCCFNLWQGYRYVVLQICNNHLEETNYIWISCRGAWISSKFLESLDLAKRIILWQFLECLTLYFIFVITPPQIFAFLFLWYNNFNWRKMANRLTICCSMGFTSFSHLKTFVIYSSKFYNEPTFCFHTLEKLTWGYLDFLGLGGLS